MNRQFRSLYNAALGSWVAVSELSTAHGRGRLRKKRLAAVCSLAIASGLFSSAALADCNNSGGSNYSCSGITSNSQVISGNALNVSADSSFQATASNTLALSTSNGDLSVNLAAGSTLTNSDPFSYTLGATTTGGSGNIDLTLGGNINSSGLQGVYTDMLSSGNLSITQLAGSTISGGAAIRAATNGSMSLDLAGTLTGVSTVGNNYGLTMVGNGGPVTLLQHASSQISGSLGIYAGIYTDQATFNLAGTIQGNSNDGIFLDMGGSMTAFTLNQTAGSISGADSGIGLYSDNTAPINLNLAGSVSGGSQAAILTDTAAGSAVSINLQSGANVGSSNGTALLDTLGNADVSIASGATVAGKVLLGEGNDTLTISGAANLSGITLLDGGNSEDGGVTDILGTGGAATNKLTFQNSSQTLAGANLKNWQSVNVDGGSLTLSDGTLATGSGTNPDSSLQGLVLSNGGSVSSPAALNISGDVNIGTGSMLSHAQGGSITGNVANAGSLYWQNLGQTLTINGNYHGTAGSSLSLESYLGDDSATSDQLHVTGNITGSTAISIRPVAGSPGAQTVNGIRVVQVDGSSAAGSFTLAAPAQAGAYQYLLQQGSALDGNDWYLVSHFDCSLNNSCAAANPGTPLYRPGVVNYLAAQAVANEQGMQQLSSLHQRIGSQWLQTDGGQRYWLRAYHGQQQADGAQRFGYDSSSNGIQAGYLLHDSKDAAGNRDYLAITADYARSQADFHDRLRPQAGLDARTGALSASSLGAGVVYNHTWADGSYVDVVGQLSALSNKFTDSYGGSAKQRGWRVGLSVEGGLPLARWGSWQLESQAQLQYLHTRYQGMADGSGQVDGSSNNLLRGRLGLRLSSGQPEDQTQFYGIANVFRDMGGKTALQVGGRRVEEQFARGGWELGAGMQYRLSATSQLYADFRYGQSSGGGEGRKLELNLGWKASF
ncbi:autotransporter outer membrane beta-barrel domain-containing protein [Vogesella amnigena]|uniref:Autotransporter outer membrane beta-barrel domain-containing protein n=1 Tax=Vogesella amnigena TaxID=1507449 RepID=A0ABV7TVC7_9NEIS